MQADRLKWYFYLGIALIIFVEYNFSASIQPFALWYLPIVWYGYILVVDALVYRLKRKSLISNYPKEFVLLIVLSIFFWLIFEAYNFFDGSWFYVHFSHAMHFFDFTTILPAMLETFSLLNVLSVGRGLDVAIKRSERVARPVSDGFYRNVVKLLVVFGLMAALVPFFFTYVGFPFMWIGLALLIDPFNYLTNRPSVIRNVCIGKRSIVIQLCLSGLIMGFFWEFWNFQAFPKWLYTFPIFLPGMKLFEMPLLGYFGYMPFAMEAYLFSALFRSLFFKKGNELLSM